MRIANPGASGSMHRFPKRMWMREGALSVTTQRLLALEEDLISAREALFALSRQPRSSALPSTVERTLGRVKELEGDVAETRRVLQWEAVHSQRTCGAMQAIFEEIEAERRKQGYALTTLVLQASFC